MADEVNFSKEAQEALQIIGYLREHGGNDVANNYHKAESFIKENGDVSTTFLDSLRKRKAELKPEK